MLRSFSSLMALASLVLAKDQMVSVGLNGLTFTPATVTAEIGDTITFAFYAKNHTVTQSGFADPCTHLVNATTGQQGFKSGFIPVAAGAETVPTVTLTVNTTSPIWYFCGQAPHCQMGMVGAINPPTEGNTYDKFLAAAKAAPPSASGAAAPPGASGSTLPAGSAVAAATPSTVDDSGAVSLALPKTLFTMATFAAAFIIFA